MNADRHRYGKGKRGQKETAVEWKCRVGLAPPKPIFTFGENTARRRNARRDGGSPGCKNGFLPQLYDRNALMIRYHISRATLFRLTVDASFPQPALSVGKKRYGTAEQICKFEKRGGTRRIGGGPA